MEESSHWKTEGRKVQLTGHTQGWRVHPGARQPSQSPWRPTVEESGHWTTEGGKVQLTGHTQGWRVHPVHGRIHFGEK